MPFCDLLFSADLMRPRPDETLGILMNAIGLPKPGPGAFVEYPEEGFRVVFALVNKSFSTAPTRLELIGPEWFPGQPPASIGQRVFDRQRRRACKTHATVVATPHIDETIERVRSLGLRHWVQQPTDDVPFTRLWMGAGEGDPGDYQEDADGGLVLEIIPSNSPAFPPKILTPPAEPVGPAQADMIRIVARAFLVDDLDVTLKLLENHFGWMPAGPVVDDRKLGLRRATMSANLSHGASLELVQAADADSNVGRYYGQWGRGPYTIRIAVADLSAKAKDLRERGTVFDWRGPTAKSVEALVPDPSCTAEAPFEFVTL